MNYIFVLFVIFFFNTNLVRSDKSFVQYRWMLNDKWSSCSKKCDEGIEVRTPICVKNFIGQITGVDPSNCNPDEIPQNATRACNYGNCNDKYRWIVSKYGTCSQVCLDNGIIKRTVSCLPMYEEYNENSNLIPRIVDSNLCNPNKKPRNKDSCNRMDCEPDFKALEWGECDQNDVCVKGKQTRKVKCVIKKLDGKEEEVKLKYCTSLKKKKPKKWRQCTKNNSETCKMNVPEIDKDSITVVQMKRNRILNLKVGQNAFVIPLTKLTIHCPTTFFANQDLKWYHEKHGTIEYNGTSIERIKIDNEGRLIIENFKPIDKGLWFCKADSQSASITLAPRSVADGFLDWLRRNELMKNEQMLNEDPKTMHTYQEIIQWVEAPWNECPAKCGETGTQTRQVRCEKVKARSYEVLDDDACNERGLPKPKSSRECKIIDECPKLRFVPSNPEICSNECVKPGFAKVAGEYICELDEKVVSLDQCENVKIEDNFCENSSCKLKWQTGAWSKCNKECGENSYQSRSIKCIWESTQLSAGSLCLNENLTLPNAIKMCPNKPCTLECINMIKNCEDRKKLCRISMFQFYCCQTCKLYIEEIRSSN